MSNLDDSALGPMNIPFSQQKRNEVLMQLPEPIVHQQQIPVIKPPNDDSDYLQSKKPPGSLVIAVASDDLSISSSLIATKPEPEKKPEVKP